MFRRLGLFGRWQQANTTLECPNLMNRGHLLRQLASQWLGLTLHRGEDGPVGAMTPDTSEDHSVSAGK